MSVYTLWIYGWLAWDPASFFDWLAARPWYTRILTEWVAALPIEAGTQGLEVGCGPGHLTGQLHAGGAQMTGLDRSPAMVQRAREKVPGCTFIEGDALALPLEDDTVDVAVAASVVNVVSNPQLLVQEMARVVRPGGCVSVLFPTPALAQRAGSIGQRRSLQGLSAAALATWGARAPKREPASIRDLFERAGLHDVRVDHIFDGAVASVTGRVV
jgi:ubiquinone/menaquinone biosynthesis C-methylase UbiE